MSAIPANLKLAEEYHTDGEFASHARVAGFTDVTYTA